MSKRVELRLPPELIDELELQRPRTQSLSRFCALLIEQGLDKPLTLGGPETGTPSNTLTSTISSTSNSSNNSLIELSVVSNENEALEQPQSEPKPSRKRKASAESGPEFEAFWKQYLAIKHRANGQTKPAAVEAWRKVTKEITPAQLQAALSAAVNEQARATRETGWAAPFPDCHRWLGKGYWQQHASQSAEPVLAFGPDLTPPPEFPDAPF